MLLNYLLAGSQLLSCCFCYAVLLLLNAADTHYGSTSASDFLFFKFSWWGCFYVPVRTVNVGAVPVRRGTPTTNDQPADQINT